MLVILILIAMVIAFGLLFVKYSPVFGAKPSERDVRSFKHSKNFHDGKFVNLIPTSTGTNLKTSIDMLLELIKGNPQKTPAGQIPVVPWEVEGLPDGQQGKVLWLGHSTFLLEVDGQHLLLDPMFSKSPSPIPVFGPKRYYPKLPMEIAELPTIDAVLISHDHYDHLDYQSILGIKDKVKVFLVPLGVGSHLEKWGVAPEKIKECDWWEEYQGDSLTVACTPARHFSGRALTDRDATLWCSWVILGQKYKIYFSGDTGYGPHFQEIGHKYGPIDLTLMECGQYDERWAAIHMQPEQTVQAHQELQGKLLVPIHWCAFTLAFHNWNDPVERITKAGKVHGVPVATPKIGEPVLLGSKDYPNSTWWR